MTTVELKDTKTAPDPIHNYSHKNGAVLVIDNGAIFYPSVVFFCDTKRFY